MQVQSVLLFLLGYYKIDQKPWLSIDKTLVVISLVLLYTIVLLYQLWHVRYESVTKKAHSF